MNIRENTTKILFSIAIILVLLISSCGQASFDVGIDIKDTGPISLSALTSLVKVQAELAVPTGNLGIDLEELIYAYTVANRGNDTITLNVKLSLYGEATTANSPKIRLIGSGFESEPEWLDAPYENTVEIAGGITKGWVSMIIPMDISSGDKVSAVNTLLSNAVINQILKQDTVWIVADITTGSPVAVNNTLEISNQSIQATGSKDTGYFPGAFGTM